MNKRAYGLFWSCLACCKSPHYPQGWRQQLLGCDKELAAGLVLAAAIPAGGNEGCSSNICQLLCWYKCLDPSADLVLNLLCCRWISFYLLCCHGRSGSSSALPKCTLILKNSSRGRKTVTPANQEHNEGSSDFLLLCQYCLITCSSETKAHLSFLIQPFPHTNTMHTCLRIYSTLQANQTGELPNLNNLRRGPALTDAGG